MKFSLRSSRHSLLLPRRCVLPLLMTIFLPFDNWVKASVYPTKPTAGTTYIAGQAGAVDWIDDGKKPLLGAMGKMRIELYARNDTFIATLARDIQPMALHTTILVPPISPVNNHDYTMRFITIDPALTIYSANFAIIPNPLTYQPHPALASSLGSMPSIGVVVPATGVVNTRLGGVAPSISMANRPGMVTMSRHPLNANPPYPTPSAPPYATTRSPSPEESVNPDEPFQTSSAVRRGLSIIRRTRSLNVTRKGSAKKSSGDPNSLLGGQGEPRSWLGLKVDVWKFIQGFRRKVEGSMDAERIKFKIVFILWPAMVGLTLAF